MKSKADRVMLELTLAQWVRLGLGLTLAQWVRVGLGLTLAQCRQNVVAQVRQDPPVAVKCGNIGLWKHRTVGT